MDHRVEHGVDSLTARNVSDVHDDVHHAVHDTVHPAVHAAEHVAVQNVVHNVVHLSAHDTVRSAIHDVAHVTRQPDMRSLDSSSPRSMRRSRVTCARLPQRAHVRCWHAACCERRQSVGTWCVLTCRHGYLLLGSRAQRCTHAGRWSHAHRMPVCVRTYTSMHAHTHTRTLAAGTTRIACPYASVRTQACTCMHIHARRPLEPRASHARVRPYVHKHARAYTYTHASRWNHAHRMPVCVRTYTSMHMYTHTRMPAAGITRIACPCTQAYIIGMTIASQ